MNIRGGFRTQIMKRFAIACILFTTVLLMVISTCAQKSDQENLLLATGKGTSLDSAVVVDSVDVSNPQEVLNAAIMATKNNLGPIWDVMPSENDSAKQRLAFLKNCIKNVIFQVNISFRLGSYDEVARGLPLRIQWPRGTSSKDIFISDQRDLKSIDIKTTIEKKGFLNTKEIIHLGMDLFSNFEKHYYIEKGYKNIVVPEPNPQKAKIISKGTRAVALTYLVRSGWQRNNVLEESRGIVVEPLYICLLGARRELLKAVPWPNPESSGT